VAPISRLLCLLAIVLLGAAAAGAQAGEELAPFPPDTTAHLYGTSAALALLLTEDGLGAGGAGRTALTPDLSFVFETALGAGRDEREQRFFVGFFGETVTPLKRNYAVLVPLHVGLERRLFRRQVEDNFRPFVALTAGPTIALQWPYFDDADRDGVRDSGEERLGPLRGFVQAQPRLGLGGTLSVGAAVGRAGQAIQSLRFGFTGHVFPARIDLLELDPEVESPSRRTFWTPTVSFHVVRLLR
jgi:hypothetical protein